MPPEEKPDERLARVVGIGTSRTPRIIYVGVPDADRRFKSYVRFNRDTREYFRMGDELPVPDEPEYEARGMDLTEVLGGEAADVFETLGIPVPGNPKETDKWHGKDPNDYVPRF